MWNYLTLTRHEDGCTIIRRDGPGPGFGDRAACHWEILVRIMKVCQGLANPTPLSIFYTDWWVERPAPFLTVREAGVTFVMYQYADEAGRAEAAMGALRAMFEELGVDFNFSRLRPAADAG